MTRHEREVARDLYRKCFFCAGSILKTPLEDLVEVTDHANRLAHRDCSAAEADDGATE